jgi:hypothetical protein
MKRVATLRSTGVILLSLALLFASALGQQASSSARSYLNPLARLIGRGPHASGVGQVSTPDTATPAWTSNFRFTPDTALVQHSAVYDPATNTMIVFGGIDWGIQGFDTNAVLLYAPANGNGNWTTLIANGVAGAPAERDSHSAVYDAANNRMIVFGGETSSFVDLNDIWVLSNANGQGGTATWTQLSPSGSPPAARYFHTAVYDATNNQMTIFGGGDNTQSFSDVWVLSNANGLGGTPVWTQLSPGGAAPMGVFASSAVYDPANNIMTVFGGLNLAGTAATNGVWTLSHANGLGGAPQWTNIVANGKAGSPPKRAAHTAVYDVANNRMIIFGGTAFSGKFSFSGYNDIWVLAFANGLGGTPAWTKLKPPGLAPGPRVAHTAVYDAINNRMMVLSGDNADAVYYVVWVLSHANGL